MPRIRIECNYRHTQILMLATRSPCTGLLDAACYEFYQLRLFHSLNFFHVVLHAYVLLPDQVWLLATPRDRQGATRLVAAVSRAYRAYFNTRFQRATNPWSPRCHVSGIYGDDMVLACQKLIEREPVRRTLVRHAGAWRWSSYCANAFGGGHPFLEKHRAVSEFLFAGCDPGHRYRTCVAQPFTAGHSQYLLNRIERSMPVGSSRQGQALRQAAKRKSDNPDRWHTMAGAVLTDN